MQIIYIRKEYLISYNCVRKTLKRQLHKNICINVQFIYICLLYLLGHITFLPSLIFKKFFAQNIYNFIAISIKLSNSV